MLLYYKTYKNRKLLDFQDKNYEENSSIYSELNSIISIRNKTILNSKKNISFKIPELDLTKAKKIQQLCVKKNLGNNEENFKIEKLIY